MPSIFKIGGIFLIIEKDRIILTLENNGSFLVGFTYSLHFFAIISIDNY